MLSAAPRRLLTQYVSRRLISSSGDTNGRTQLVDWKRAFDTHAWLIEKGAQCGGVVGCAAGSIGGVYAYSKSLNPNHHPGMVVFPVAGGIVGGTYGVIGGALTVCFNPVAAGVSLAVGMAAAVA